ncbi:MAG: PD-(D/E)XK nuclease family protein [Fimbriimonadaceae bacterium]|nr:MAG: PD-(D/E)XK nuclease family protein [Fimbriimonadaceae bacterium]
MTEGRLRLLGVPPGGSGVKSAAQRLMRQGTLVTSLDDPLLRCAHAFLPPGSEVEVLPFGAVLSRTLDLLGVQRAGLVTRGQLRAMVAMALGDLPDDTPLSASSAYAGTVRLVTDRLRELSRWGITGSEMRAIAESVGPPCRSKLHTLADIHDLVADSMDVSNRETATDYVRRCLSLGRTDGIFLPHLLVFLGAEDHPVFERWFLWATEQGCDIDLVVEHDPKRPSTFQLAGRVAKRLELNLEPLEGPEPWTSRLFGGPATQTPPPSVTVLCAGDPLAEAEWALRRCLELRANGAAWSAMGVYARDQASYAPMLTAAGARLGVPVLAPRSVSLLSNGFAQLVLGVLRALASTGVRSFAKLSRNPYFDAPRSFTGLLWEAACRFDSDDGDPWASLVEWMESRASEAPWAPAVLAWRIQATTERRRFTAWLNLFRDLVGATTLVESVASHDRDTRERDLLAQTVLQRSLADHAFVYDQSGRSELSLHGFVDLCESIWSDETVQLPVSGEGVKVVSSGHAFGPLQAVFAVGLLEGSLPRRRREDPLFNDDDRAEISKVWGIPLLDSNDLAGQERDEFVRVCQAATDELTFSYPQSTGESDSVPAFYLQDLETSFDGHVRHVSHSRVMLAPPLEGCIAESDRRLREALEEPRQWPEAPILTAPHNVARVRRSEEEDVELRELTAALDCPFQAAARYRLGLRGEPLEEGPWLLTSLPIEAALPTAPDPESALAALWEAYAEMFDRRRSRHDDYSSAMLRRAADRAFRHWVEVEFKGRETLARDAGSVRYQVSFQELGVKKIVGTIPVASKIRGMPVAEAYTVDRQPLSWNEPDMDSEQLRVAMWLLALTENKDVPRGVLLSSMGEDRDFSVIGRPIRDFPKPDGTRVSGKPGGGPEARTRTQRRLGKGMGILRTTSMEARPGKHCETCPFGELCRSSNDYGDRHDPFQ